MGTVLSLEPANFNGMRIARPWAGVKKSDILGKAGDYLVTLLTGKPTIKGLEIDHHEQKTMVRIAFRELRPEI
jgi:hypothetical protein